MLNSYHATTIVKMLMESLMFSRYTYALPVWGPAISRDFLSRLDRLQNRAVGIFCGLWKYDCVSQCRAGLRWLAVSQFIQYRSILAMLGKDYLGEGVAFSPPVTFGCKHSNGTRFPLWFADFFQFKKLVNVLSDTRLLLVTWWNCLPSHLFHDLTVFRDGLFRQLLDVT